MRQAAVIILLAAMALPSQTFAETHTGSDNYHPAIGLINFQQALTESAAWQDFRQAMRQKAEALERNITQNQKQLETMRKNFEKQKNHLSAAAQRQKYDALDQEQRRRQQQIDEQTSQLDAQFARAQNHIREHIYGILRIISQERELDLILNAGVNTNAVILADPKLDVTQETVKRLNQKLPRLDEQFLNP